MRTFSDREQRDTNSDEVRHDRRTMAQLLSYIAAVAVAFLSALLFAGTKLYLTVAHAHARNAQIHCLGVQTTSTTSSSFLCQLRQAL